MKLAKNNTILITGGTGFIGINLINQLKDKGYEVISVTRSGHVNGIKNLNIDLAHTDFDFLKEIAPEYVVYLGTTSSPRLANKFPQECYESNVSTIQKFLNSAINLNIKKIVLFSTAVLYKDQNKNIYKETDEVFPFNDIYNLSKYCLENLAEFYRQKFNLPITVFRLSNTYGPYLDFDRNPILITQLFYQVLKQKRIKVLNTTPVRDWVYIEDLVKVLLKELESNESGLFNLATGKGTSVGEIVELIGELTNVPIVNLNKDVSHPLRIICDVNKLKKHIGFIPETNIKEGLYKTYNFFKQNYS